MKKANLLEEIRSELGLILETIRNKEEWYSEFIHLLTTRIAHYKSISIYLTDNLSFNYYKHEGKLEEPLVERVPFGEGHLSLVAARGEISCDFEPDGQLIYIPFYNGHHLLGQMVIKTTQFIDDDELLFMKYIHQLLSKVPN